MMGLVVWSYWPIITSLWLTLRTNDDYSASQLVPFVALFFLWRDRTVLRTLELRPCWLAGILLLVLAEGIRIYGYLSMRNSLERYALVLAIAALVLLVAGRQIFRRVKWDLLFLLLVVPLPSAIHGRISPPLQRLATSGSAFFLEALGVHAAQQGNVINLEDRVPIAVAEACSGLRMLTAFLVVTAFVAYMAKRPRWYKGVLLVSSIPVAVVCNVLRIFLTAVIMLYVDIEIGQKFFHDFAGLVMVLAAVSILFGETWLLDRIVEPEETRLPEKQTLVRAKRLRPDVTTLPGSSLAANGDLSRCPIADQHGGGMS
jgi:exosortase